MARFLSLLLAFLFLLSGVFPVPLLNAETEPSDWFKAPPVASDQFDIGGASIPYSINGNRDCIKQRIVTKPAKILPYWPYIQNEEAHDSCVVNTGYGAVSQSGYLQTAGESVFGKVYFPWGGTMTLLPIPRSAHGIYIIPHPPNGVSMHLIRDFLANIDGYTLASGEIEYRVKNGTNVTSLKDESGQLLGVQLDSVSFSSSGKWMVADMPVLGLSRIDTASLSIKTFDTSFNYSIGVAPGVQSAVTNTGRYIAVSSPNFTRFRLYDLGDCSTSLSCKHLDLYKHFSATAPGFVSAVRLRFSNDYSLRMYTVQKNGASNKVIRQTLRASGHESVSFGYLGMGDSFASGEGAYQYKATTDTGLNKCHVSLRSYPYLIAGQLGIDETESIACSGAVIEDIESTARTYKGQVKDGLELGDRENIDELLELFSPGYLPQKEFAITYEPEVITISTVGNDIGFADKIKTCLMPGTCFSTYEDRLEVANEVNAQFNRLLEMYTDIKQEMENKKVYVIGYPEIAMDNGSCGGNVRLDAEEIRFSNQLVRHLNKMIKSAADNVGFFYVDVEKAFYGHRLCEASYPSEAVNGITAGDDIVDIPFTDFGGPIGNESFHPNDLGHRKFKETILSKTNDLTAAMPAPNPNTKPPQITDSMELLNNMPKSGRVVKTVRYLNDITDENTVYPGMVVKGGLGMLETTLKPGSPVTAWMHSEPVKLGDYTVDSQGNFTFEATIPPDTPFGFHTLHIYGTNILDKPIDLQKVIYVADPSKTSPSGEPEKPIETETKPPANNPETVAGHEQLAQNTEPIENTHQNIEETASMALSPYQTPIDTQSGVAGANTDDSSPAPISTLAATEAKENNPAVSTLNRRLYILLIPITLVLLYYAIKINYKGQ